MAVTGVGNLSLSPTPIYTANLNAGPATASYNYAGDANREWSSDSETFTIAKAPSTTVQHSKPAPTFIARVHLRRPRKDVGGLSPRSLRPPPVTART